MRDVLPRVCFFMEGDTFCFSIEWRSLCSAALFSLPKTPFAPRKRVEGVVVPRHVSVLCCCRPIIFGRKVRERERQWPVRRRAVASAALHGRPVSFPLLSVAMQHTICICLHAGRGSSAREMDSKIKQQQEQAAGPPAAIDGSSARGRPAHVRKKKKIKAQHRLP